MKYQEIYITSKLNCRETVKDKKQKQVTQPILSFAEKHKNRVGAF